MTDKLLTPKQVAEYLNLAEKTIKDYLRAGKIRGVKIGNVWRVKPEDLEAFVDKHTVTKEDQEEKS